MQKRLIKRSRRFWAALKEVLSLSIYDLVNVTSYITCIILLVFYFTRLLFLALSNAMINGKVIKKK